jgi:hypothetical protein
MNKEKNGDNSSFSLSPNHEIPSYFETDQLIAKAENRDLGLLVSHSKAIAREAEPVASADKLLDKQAAAILSLLHDLGHKKTVTARQRVLDGTDFL